MVLTRSDAFLWIRTFGRVAIIARRASKIMITERSSNIITSFSILSRRFSVKMHALEYAPVRGIASVKILPTTLSNWILIFNSTCYRLTCILSLRTSKRLVMSLWFDLKDIGNSINFSRIRQSEEIGLGSSSFSSSLWANGLIVLTFFTEYKPRNIYVNLKRDMSRISGRICSSLLL